MVEGSHIDFIFHPCIASMKKILNDPEHARNAHWSFNRSSESDFSYRESWSGDWWRKQELDIERSYGQSRPNILAIMMASDATNVTLTGRSVKPFYWTTGNIHLSYRTKRSGYHHGGFFPTLRIKKAFKDKDEELIRQFKRSLESWCNQVLFDEIVQLRDGFQLSLPIDETTQRMLFVYPRLSHIIGDEPEQRQCVLNMYSTWNIQRLCSTCMLDMDVQKIWETGDLRKEKVGWLRSRMSLPKTESYLSPDDTKELSMWNEFNILLFVPGMNIFDSPACLMHQLDHGIFINMLDAILLILGSRLCGGGNATVVEFDTRWSYLGLFPEVKIFTSGVARKALLTADEHKQMSMGLPFVLRGIKVKLPPDFVMIKEAKHFLVDVSVSYLHVRYLLSVDQFTEDSLRQLEDSIGSLIKKLWVLGEICAVIRAKKIQNKSPAGQPVPPTKNPFAYVIKYHKLNHWPYYIRMFGHPGNYNSAVFETAHKFSTKKYRNAISFRGVGNAEKKLVHFNAMSDVHAVQPTMPPLTKSNFSLRGKLQVVGGKRWFSHDQCLVLACMEVSALSKFSSSQPPTTSVREYDDKLRDLFDLHGHPSMEQSRQLTHLLLLRRVLYRNQMVREYTTKLVSSDAPDLQWFHLKLAHNGESALGITLWNSVWSEPSSCYIRPESNIVYPKGTSEQVGRVYWICEVGPLQFVIVRKYRHVPYTYGPAPSSQHRCPAKQGKGSADPLRTRFHHYKLLEENDPNSYHCILLRDTFLYLAFMQPDFDTISNTYETDHWFLMEYIL